MDIPTDVWGQLALEASQVYLTEGGQLRSPFANTVMLCKCAPAVVWTVFILLFRLTTKYFNMEYKKWHLIIEETRMLIFNLLD